jgi:hypothetical protein
MAREKKLLVAVLVVGGLAVLASYVAGFLTHPDTRIQILAGESGVVFPPLCSRYTRCRCCLPPQAIFR